jgi:hypothetical protein
LFGQLLADVSQAPLFQNPVERLALDSTATHGGAYVTLEAFSVVLEVFGGLLVQRVGRVRLKKEVLQRISHGS